MGGQGTPCDAWGYSGGGHGSGGRIYFDTDSVTNGGIIDLSGGDVSDPFLWGAVGINPGVVIEGNGLILGDTVVVPEPATLAMLALGAAGGAALRLGRRR